MPITLDGTTGIGTPSVSGTTGSFSGDVAVSGTLFRAQPTPTTKSASATLTVAELLTGIIISTLDANVTLTLPTGSTLDAALPAMAAGQAFDFSLTVTNVARTTTVAANTGVTFPAGVTVDYNRVSGANQLSCTGLFRVTKTAAATYVVYRIA